MRTVKSLIPLLVGVVAVFLLWKDCTVVDGPTWEQVQLDSLMQDNLRKQASYDSLDNLYKEFLEVKDNQIMDVLHDMDSVRVQARKAQSSASYWANQYKRAREANDTPTMVSSCDSLVEENQIAYATIERERKATDSVIVMYTDRIKMSDKLIAQKDLRIAQQDTTIRQLYTAATDAVTALNRRNKFWPKFWRGVKLGAVAVAGVFIGSAIAN